MLRRTVLGVGSAALADSARAQGRSRRAASCPCGRIDVHAHFLPPAYQRAMQEAGLKTLDGGVPTPAWSEAAHLQMMTEQGIQSAVLSVSSPGLHFLEPARAVRMAREINEAGADLRNRHPDRFGYLAALPLADVPAAVAEIAHAYDHLKVDGVVLETNLHGVYLGDPRFTPVFDELERRRAVVFIHPTSPACLEQVGMGFPGPLIEFPFDTARNAVSLIYAGVLRRRPNIRVILSHGGGALPALASRIAMVAQTPLVNPRPEGGAAEVASEIRRLYFDLALAASPAAFSALRQVTHLTHILYGTDYPFAPGPGIQANNAGYEAILRTLSPAERRSIEQDNALNLFPRLRARAASPA